MASITTDKATGTRTVQFVGGDRKRRSIRLGKVPLRAAEQVRLRVELLQAAITTGTAPDAETSRWVSDLPDDLHSRLAAIGLVAAREDRSGTLGEFIDTYLASRTDLKDRTLTCMRQVRKHAVAFFGERKALRDVTPGDVDEWRIWMMQRLSDASVRRHCGRFKQIMRAALRRRLITENPAADLKDISVRNNPLRRVLITNEMARQILDQCPTLEWRVIWTLARWGGLRTPSETFALTWQDVDFENGRMTVRCIKTEHIAGHESRIVPLFPEVRAVLMELADRDQPGIDIPLSASLIGRGRGIETNLRTTFGKIIRRAGLPPIPKVFINARSSRATELADLFPGHVAAAWLGHSEQIADRHYRQITDQHYQQALNPPVSAVQNPVQYTSEPDGTGGKWKSGTPDFPEDSALFRRVPDQRYPRVDSNH